MSMSDQEWIELGNRAMACRAWRWMSGMRMMRPNCDEVFRVCDEPANVAAHVHIGGSPYDWAPEPDDVVPDLRDPATLGCLLALVREAWGSPQIGLVLFDDEANVHDGHWEDGLWIAGDDTEAHALVDALESAPEPTP